MIDRLLAPALAVERDREIEPLGGRAGRPRPLPSSPIGPTDFACSATSSAARAAATAASLRLDSGTSASVCFACSIAPVDT
jgi:hypothetical protein